MHWADETWRDDIENVKCAFKINHSKQLREVLSRVIWLKSFQTEPIFNWEAIRTLTEAKLVACEQW